MRKTKLSIARHRVATVWWWVVTLAVLIVLDDLVYGPLFWIASLLNVVWATVAAFAASFAFQMWLNMAYIRTAPAPWAQRVVDRLTLARKSPSIERRERTIQQRAVSYVGAIMVTPIIGGVLPVVFLYRRGAMDVGGLRRLAVLTSGIYATEFALIHGGYGLGAVLASVPRWFA